MAVQINIKAMVRDQFGKEAGKKLRRQGLTPAILYGSREKALPLFFNTNEFLKLTHGEIHENMIFNLEINLNAGQKEKAMAIVKELQFEPITDSLVHVDFYEMTVDKPVSVEVPVEAVGEARGVKIGGGILEHVTREILISCLPGAIPDSIKVDVSHLDAGGVLHIRDLVVPEGIHVLEDSDRVLFTIGHGSKVTTTPTAEEQKAPAAE